MVLTRFAWPYGGHHVYLSGSFTGWREHSMTLVEGSSTVFQAIFNLEPGYHQYKFLADGIWHHDEQLPFVTDEYGKVNNIIYVRESELVPPILLTGVSVPGMDVDNGVFQHVASLSGAIHREPITRVSDADLRVSRRQLSLLLSRYTAYDLLPESGKVFALDVKVPVEQAFHIMYEQGLAVVPLWDESRGQFSGMLTASDFISILTKLHANGSMLTSEELEMHSISAWKEEKLRTTRNSDGSEQLFRRPLIHAGPHDSLKDVALRILQNEISTVPIIHSSMQDGSCPQLLHVACLSGILNHICRHFRHSPGSVSLLQQPIYAISLGTWVSDIGRGYGRELVMLRSNAPLSSALTSLVEGQISSVPIVDDNGSLLDVYSRSDITALANGRAYAHIRLDQTSMLQALQLGYNANDVINGRRRCQMCLRSDSLHEIMERLSDPVLRRLIVVEPGSKRVEGIITLRDVFNFLLR
ncbi:sucrose nonfermenting 4-like protein [Tasmannia lanceolata]|uniref:sucrose nonfermenting 4-like protein n=1 Tax=Tasmannia lanceolata TaxID=3420 RepID=UPI00406340DF